MLNISASNLFNTKLVRFIAHTLITISIGIGIGAYYKKRDREYIIKYIEFCPSKESRGADRSRLP